MAEAKFVAIPAGPASFTSFPLVGGAGCQIGQPRSNQRVVRVKLGYAAEETCAVP